MFYMFRIPHVAGFRQSRCTEWARQLARSATVPADRRRCRDDGPGKDYYRRAIDSARGSATVRDAFTGNQKHVVQETQHIHTMRIVPTPVIP